MPKTKWESKNNEINFRLKEWRQDLAYYIENKLFTNKLYVSKSFKNKGTNNYTFDITNEQNFIKVEFNDKHDILHSDTSLVKDYLTDKGVKDE